MHGSTSSEPMCCEPATPRGCDCLPPTVSIRMVEELTQYTSYENAGGNFGWILFRQLVLTAVLSGAAMAGVWYLSFSRLRLQRESQLGSLHNCLILFSHFSFFLIKWNLVDEKKGRIFMPFHWTQFLHSTGASRLWRQWSIIYVVLNPCRRLELVLYIIQWGCSCWR